MAISVGPTGITANGSNVLTYDSDTGQVEIFHNGTAVLQTLSTGVQASTVTASLSGNGSTASRLQTARNIQLTGDVTGSVSFDGSSNVSLATTLTASNIVSGDFSSPVTLNIINSSGTTVKTLRGPGS